MYLYPLSDPIFCFEKESFDFLPKWRKCHCCRGKQKASKHLKQNYEALEAKLFNVTNHHDNGSTSTSLTRRLIDKYDLKLPVPISAESSAKVVGIIGSPSSVKQDIVSSFALKRYSKVADTRGVDITFTCDGFIILDSSNKSRSGIVKQDLFHSAFIMLISDVVVMIHDDPNESELNLAKLVQFVGSKFNYNLSSNVINVDTECVAEYFDSILNPEKDAYRVGIPRKNDFGNGDGTEHLAYLYAVSYEQSILDLVEKVTRMVSTEENGLTQASWLAKANSTWKTLMDMNDFRQSYDKFK